MESSNNVPSGAGATATSANARTMNRKSGDADTAEFVSSKTRSPYHSTEGGNYHYKDPMNGWGGNVNRGDPERGTYP